MFDRICFVPLFWQLKRCVFWKAEGGRGGTTLKKQAAVLKLQSPLTVFTPGWKNKAGLPRVVWGYGLYKHEWGVGMATAQTVPDQVQHSSCFTWTQTHQYVALCCPGGSDVGFCTCLFLPWRSQRAACRFAFSLYHPELLPTLNSVPTQRNGTESRVIAS